MRRIPKFIQKMVWALVKRIVVGHIKGCVEILVGMLLLVPELFDTFDFPLTKCEGKKRKKKSTKKP